GKAEIVKQVDHRAPLVERGGKLVAARADQFGLANATVYAAGQVTFDPNFTIAVWHHRAEQVEFAYELRVDGRVTTDTTFRHCFIVMEEVAPTEKASPSPMCPIWSQARRRSSPCSSRSAARPRRATTASIC